MKRILCTLLLVFLLVPMFCIGTGAEVYTDRAIDVEAVVKANTGATNLSEEEREFFESAVTCKINFKLDTEKGELDIYRDESATQVEYMLSYIAPHWVPWQNENPGEFSAVTGENGAVIFDPDKALLQSVKTVRVHEGIGSLGRYSLAYGYNVEEVYLPHSLRKINRTVFYQCEKLETVYYAGNENDFKKVVIDEVRNWVGTDTDGNNTIEEGEVEFRMTDKIHFGESVTVVCKNEEGDVITEYTVGGYFVGDEYTITPPAMEGMSYVGEQQQIVGKFKSGDKTRYELTYRCEHDYQLRFPSIPCSSFCTKCGRSNPDFHDQHTWGEPVVVSEYGFLTPLNQSVICQKCNAKVSEYKAPYGPVVAICVAAPILLAGIAFAIILPIRKRRKMKDMTW